MNFRTIAQLRCLEAASGFESAFFDGRVIYDPTGEIAQHVRRLNEKRIQSSSRQLTDDDVARIRHWHKHVLDKVEGRTDSRPTFCSFLLSANILWLIENYFRIRHIEYKGPKAAFDYIEQGEPEIYARIQNFYLANSLEQKLQLTRELTELILQPVNGMWRDDEVLAFGDKSSQALQ